MVGTGHKLCALVTAAVTTVIPSLTRLHSWEMQGWALNLGHTVFPMPTAS